MVYLTNFKVSTDLHYIPQFLRHHLGLYRSHFPKQYSSSFLMTQSLFLFKDTIWKSHISKFLYYLWTWRWPSSENISFPNFCLFFLKMWPVNIKFPCFCLYFWRCDQKISNFYGNCPETMHPHQYHQFVCPSLGMHWSHIGKMSLQSITGDWQLIPICVDWPSSAFNVMPHFWYIQCIRGKIPTVLYDSQRLISKSQQLVNKPEYLTIRY